MPRPGNAGAAGRASNRPTDWRIPPWHHREDQNRHRARRREVVALDVRHAARQRGAREQVRRKYAPQQGLTAPQRVAQPKPKIRPLAQTKRGAHRHQPIHPSVQSSSIVATGPNRPTRRRLWSRGCDGFASSRSYQASPAAFGAGGRRRLQPRWQCGTRAHDAHPFCQDEKTRLPAEMLRLDSRTICFLEFEPPDFCNLFRPSSTMNRLRKAAFKSDSKSSHWDRFPMGRFFASTSTHTQTQRCSETANLNKLRGFKASTSNTGLARS